MTPQKPGIDVGIVVADLDAMVAFYTTVLGLRPGATRTTGWGDMAELHAGDSVVRLLRPPSEPARHEAAMTAVTGLRYLTLPVDDLDASLAAAEAAGAPVVAARTAVRDVTFAMVADPEGNVVEFLHRAGA